MSRLSRRQAEVLLWAARGKTAWETAAILGLSHETVRRHRASAKENLDAVNITHAVVLALTTGKLTGALRRACLAG